MTRAAALDSGVGASAIYSLPARVAHWLTAVFVIVAFFVGLTMLRVGQGELQNQLFDLHRSLGATVFALAALRLLWRLWHPPPPLPPETPGWIKLSAWLSHRLLYAFILILPIIGWLGSSAFGAPVHILWALRPSTAGRTRPAPRQYPLRDSHLGRLRSGGPRRPPYRGGSLSSARPPGFRLPPHGGVRQLRIPRISQLPRADLTPILPAS